MLIGPSVLERVLVDALPRAAIAPDRFGKAVPQAVRAWTDWLAERNKLTDRSRRRLGFSLRATLVRFAGAWYGPGAHPLRRYLDRAQPQRRDGASRRGARSAAPPGHPVSQAA